MNAFNRVFMTLFALLLVAAGVVAFLLIAHVLSPADLPDGCVVVDLVDRIVAAVGGSQAAAYGLSGALVVVGGLLLVFELLPRRRSSTFLVDTTELGTMTVERDGLCRMAERVASDIEGVIGARASMESRDGAVACRCVVSVHSDAPVKDIAAEVQSQLRASVEQQVGIRLEEVEVKARITNEPRPEPRRVVD